MTRHGVAPLPSDDLAAFVELHGGNVEFDPPLLELEYGRVDTAKSGDVSRRANAAATEFFLTSDDASREVSIVQSHLDFGIASRFRHPDKKAVVVKNRTAAKITVTWQVPDSYDGDDDRDWEVRHCGVTITARAV